MNDDPWMKELGRVAREDRAQPAEGAADDLVRPLSIAELDAIAAKATAQLDAERGSARVVRLRPRAREQRGSESRRRSAPLLVAAALAIAASVALAVAWPRAGGEEPIASYEVIVEGAARAVRSTDPAPSGDPVRVAKGGRLTILLRPTSPSTRAIGASAFVDRGGVLAPWAVTPEVSREGAVRIDADEAALAALPKGKVVVVLFVGVPSVVPVGADAARRARQAPGGGVRVLTFAADVE